MLIRSVRAEDFMRFSRLVVEDLPLRGVVGIEGPNESGKSTIGESVLFALFGRTRRSAGGSITDLIRWGSESLRVEVQFVLEPAAGSADVQAAPAGEYLIYREIDKQGTNYVKLVELPGRNELATGNIEVDRFLKGRLGLDFDEFQRSFYHDQYDSRRLREDQISFFETATGITPIEAAKDALREEVTCYEREFANLQKELSRAVTQIEKYDRNVQKLDSLGDRSREADAALSRSRDSLRGVDKSLERLDQERQRGREWLKGVKAASGRQIGAAVELIESRLEECAANEVPLKLGALERFRDFGRAFDELLRSMKDEVAELDTALDEGAAQGAAAESRRVRASIADLTARRASRAVWSWGTLAVAFVLIAFTIFLLPEVISLDGLLPTVEEGSGWRKWRTELTSGSLQTLPWVSGAVGLVLLLAGGRLRLRAMSDRIRLAEAESAAAELDEELDGLRESRGQLRAGLEKGDGGDVRAVLECVRSSHLSRLERRVAEMEERHAELLQSKDPFEVLAAEARRADKGLEDWIRREREKLKKERNVTDEAVKQAHADRSRVLNEQRECESQAAKKKVLEDQKCDLEERAATTRGEIDLRLNACRLLDEASGKIRSRMGPALANFARHVLPRLTSGRYRDVKVVNGVDLRVFSAEKGDFLFLDELSGGTNEAVSLALRLALSQALVQSRTRSRQFVLLDEPFKMMDSSRTVSTLRTLRQISADMTQFLVLQPTFSAEERGCVDAMIHTRSESHVLEVASVEAASAGSEPVLPPESGAVGG